MDKATFPQFDATDDNINPLDEVKLEITWQPRGEAGWWMIEYSGPLVFTVIKPFATADEAIEFAKREYPGMRPVVKRGSK